MCVRTGPPYDPTKWHPVCRTLNRFWPKKEIPIAPSRLLENTRTESVILTPSVSELGIRVGPRPPQSWPKKPKFRKFHFFRGHCTPMLRTRAAVSVSFCTAGGPLAEAATNFRASPRTSPPWDPGANPPQIIHITNDMLPTLYNSTKTRNAWQSLAYSRSAPQCRPVATSSETKTCYHLANVQRMHIVSVCQLCPHYATLFGCHGNVP